MEKNFYNRDFEELVKSSADQYRMFPSEKVWKGINNKLHTQRRWYGAGLAFLLISIGTVTWVMFTNPASTKNAQTKAIAQNNTRTKEQIKKADKNEVFIAPKIDVKLKSTNKSISSLPSITSSTVSVEQPLDVVISNNTEIPSSNTFEEPVFSLPIIAENASVPKTALPAKQNIVVTVEKISKQSERNIPTPQLDISAPEKAIIAERNADVNLGTEISTKNIKNVSVEQSLENIIATSKNNEVEAMDPERKSLAQSPYTIESITNSYIKLSKPKKSYWQIYFAPTVTYRSLKENKAFIKAARAASTPINANSPAPVNFTIADLEHVVTHKADIGFQLGATYGHSLSKRLRFVTGFQFNVNKYDIKAFGNSAEVATISLNTLGSRSSVSTVTSYRVIGTGYQVDWLRNFYFSASVPIGLEYIVAKSKKGYIGIGGNVQPTYVLDNKSYLVSTDYKNYAQVPSLTRHWNVNTGAEIFAGIINKKSEWRIAPQLRYQTLSSYKNTYPIRENLFDFGVKLGLLLK